MWLGSAKVLISVYLKEPKKVTPVNFDFFQADKFSRLDTKEKWNSEFPALSKKAFCALAGYLRRIFADIWQGFSNIK